MKSIFIYNSIPITSPNRIVYIILFLFFITAFTNGLPLCLISQDQHWRYNNAGNNGKYLPNSRLILDVRPTTQTIILDGVLEPGWESAIKIHNFVEVQPAENVKPLVETEAFVTFDDQNFYFAFVCYDPEMQKIRTSMCDRDEIFQDDFVGIIFDPNGDQQTGYEIFVNPYGIQADLIRYQNGAEDVSYDAVWYSEGKMYADRWIIEAKVPFQSLRFPNRPDQAWLVHFLRIYPRESRHQISWMPFDRNNSSFFGQAGILKMNLEKTPGRNKIEALPYFLATSGRTMQENENGYGIWGKNKAEAAAGFNLKYGLSSATTVDLAFNPDFSQIEADAGQISVNNTFALFYNEKRPFFLEGNDIFNLEDLRIVYTRTVNDPIAAGKITGKTGKLSYGFISAYDESTPFIIPYEEKSVQFGTDKNSFVNIARIKYALGQRSYAGLFVTGRSIEDGGSNLTSLMDANLYLSEKYKWTGRLGFSFTREPDDSVLTADYISPAVFKAGGQTRTAALDGESFSGLIARTAFSRSARDWSYNVYYEDRSPGFRADNGFISANNRRTIGAWTGYDFYYENHSILNQLEPQIQFYRLYNYDGKLKDFTVTPSLWMSLKGQTSVYLAALVVNNENYKGRQFNRMQRAWINLNTNVTRSFSGGFFVQTGNYVNRDGNENDSRNPLAVVKGFQYEVWLTLKPVPNLTNSLDYISFDLWTHYGGAKIISQRILRNTFSYQFTRRLFMRLITDFNFIDQYDSDEGKIIHSTGFSVDPLFSYKINPFTVFFIGGHIGGDKNPYPNRDGYTMTGQSVFAKFQYFVRL